MNFVDTRSVFDEDSMMSHFHNMERRRHRRHILSAAAISLSIAGAILLASQFAIAQSKAKDPVRTDDKGKKYVNKIPYDVFFDNPLQVVNNNKTVAPSTETPAETPTEKPKSPAPDASASKSGGTAWQDVIPMAELQGEVKTIRNSLTKAMANPAQYGQNFKVIAQEGAELAALAGIAQEHSEAISWKDKAQYVRDFGAQLNQSAIGLGKENYDKTKIAYQKLTSVLDGSVPADAGDVPTTRPFNEGASRKGLMKRIERAKDWLKQDVNSEAKFKSLSDQIQHEAAILGALGTVITTNGYEYTENDDYQQFAKSLIDGAKDVYGASKEESYDRFKQAIDKINKSCTDCHGLYGNG
jgi:hypothetical protein